MRFKNFLAFGFTLSIFGGAALLGVPTIEPPAAQARPLEGTYNNRNVRRSPRMTAEEFDRRYNPERYQQMQRMEQARQCWSRGAAIPPNTLPTAAWYIVKHSACSLQESTSGRPPQSSCGSYDAEQRRRMGIRLDNCYNY